MLDSPTQPGDLVPLSTEHHADATVHREPCGTRDLVGADLDAADLEPTLLETLEQVDHAN